MTNLKTTIRLYLKRTPLIYSFLKKNFSQGGTVCNKDTNLCIEGYPSSSNSYTYHLLKYLTVDANFGHHCHSFANVKIALNYNIPSIVLIRAPKDCISSNLARFNFGLNEGIMEYIDFHRLVKKYHSNLIIITFDEIINHTEKTLKKLEHTLNLVFKDYNDLEDVSKQVKLRMEKAQEKMGSLENISLPSNKRNRLKDSLKKEIMASKYYPDALSLFHELEAYSILKK